MGTQFQVIPHAIQTLFNELMVSTVGLSCLLVQLPQPEYQDVKGSGYLVPGANREGVWNCGGKLLSLEILEATAPAQQCSSPSQRRSCTCHVPSIGIHSLNLLPLINPRASDLGLCFL